MGRTRGRQDRHDKRRRRPVNTRLINFSCFFILYDGCPSKSFFDRDSGGQDKRSDAVADYINDFIDIFCITRLKSDALFCQIAVIPGKIRMRHRFRHIRAQIFRYQPNPNLIGDWGWDENRLSY